MKRTIKYFLTGLTSLSFASLAGAAGVMIDSTTISATTTGPTQPGDFGPANTLDGDTLEGFRNTGDAGPPARLAEHQGNHWITNDIAADGAGLISTSITYDLGAAYDLVELNVLNTSNTNWNDRETDQFTIETSTNGGTSYSAPSAVVLLQDYTAGFQVVPLVASGVTNVRLNVSNDTATGTVGGADRAVGLNEVQFFEAIPEPSAALLGGLGLLFMLRRKRI